MNKEFIPYEQALELKELGFVIPFNECLGWHLNDLLYYSYKLYSIPAYTFSQSFRWFREKYNYHQFIQKYEDTFFCCVMTDGWSAERFDTYEEAEIACLKKLIEIAKKNNI